jgi:hypothetical protein
MSRAWYIFEPELTMWYRFSFSYNRTIMSSEARKVKGL